MAVASSADRTGVEVEPLRRDRPLAEVDVLVPQAGDQPPALGVVLADAGQAFQGGADLGDATLVHLDVDGSVVAGAWPELDEPCVAQEEAAHAAPR